MPDLKVYLEKLEKLPHGAQSRISEVLKELIERELLARGISTDSQSEFEKEHQFEKSPDGSPEFDRTVDFDKETEREFEHLAIFLSQLSDEKFKAFSERLAALRK